MEQVAKLPLSHSRRPYTPKWSILSKFKFYVGQNNRHIGKNPADSLGFSRLSHHHVGDSLCREEFSILAIDVDFPEVGGTAKMYAARLGYHLAFGG